MQRIFKLAKVLRRGTSFMGREKKEENEAVGSTSDLIMPVLIVVVAAGLFYLTYKFSDIIELFGGGETLMTAVFLLVGAINVVFTLLELINTMYMSSELRTLSVLPLSATDIAGARILNASFLQFGIAAGVIIPSLVGFGVKTGASILFYLTAFSGVVLVPLFAIFTATILTIFIMTFLRIFRNRDVVTIIGVVLAFIFYILYATFSNGSSMEELGDTALVLMKTLSGFSSVIPVIPFLVKFYATGNGLMLLVGILIVLIALALMIVFIRVFYFRGAMGIYSGGKGTGEIKNIRTAVRRRSVKVTLIKRELHTIFRTPAFYLYGWVITLFWPVIVIIPMILKMDLNEIFSIFLGEDMSSLTEGEFGIIIVSSLCLVSFLISVIVVGMSNFAYNSISREGQSFFFNKIIPVSFTEQIRAKRDAAALVSLIGTTVYSLIGVLVVVFVLKLAPAWAIIPTILISFMTTIVMNNIQIYLGVRKANIEWTDEATIGKMVSTPLMITAIIMFIGMPILFLISLMQGIPAVAWIFELIIILAILTVMTEKVLLKKAEEKMGEI